MERRKFVVGLGALAAGSSAAVGTGAFTAAEINGRDANINVVSDTDGLIGLKAGGSDLVSDDGGENGNQLAIDFDPDGADGSGVNPNSTYQVGGLGGVDNLDEIPGAPGAVPSAEEIAIDTESHITESYAFKLTNQSGSSHAVELTYDANDADFPEDARVYMVSYAPDGSGTSEKVSALETRATPNKRRASILYSDDADWSESLDSGNVVYVTLIVKVGDAATDTNLGGEIIVRAGSHDDFIDPDSPE